MTDIEVFDNFFDKETFFDLTSKIYHGDWKFGSSSNRDPYTNGDLIEERINGNYLNPNSTTSIFWNMDLSSNEYFTTNIFSEIKEKISMSPSLDLVYANGQTFGQGGDFHVDDMNGFTFLLFCNRIWNFDWGGKTAFLFQDGETKYLDPKPNRAILFPGSILHRSEEVSKKFGGLRITLAYKLRP